MKSLLFLLLLLMVVPAGAGAAEFYRYETEDGVVAFVDSEKKIPARYRDTAVQKTQSELEDYAKLTISQTRSSSARASIEPAAGHTSCDGPIRTRTKEFRWVDGAFGAPGEVYTRVAVIHEDGEIVAVELDDPDTVVVVHDDLCRR
jgi:hypothetical protein